MRQSHRDFADDDINIDKVHVETIAHTTETPLQLFSGVSFLSPVTLRHHLLVLNRLMETSAVMGVHLERGTDQGFVLNCGLHLRDRSCGLR